MGINAKAIQVQVTATCDVCNETTTTQTGSTKEEAMEKVESGSGWKVFVFEDKIKCVCASCLFTFRVIDELFQKKR